MNISKQETVVKSPPLSGRKLSASKKRVANWLKANAGQWFFLRRVASQLEVPVFLVRSVIKDLQEAGMVTVEKRNQGMNRQWKLKLVVEPVNGKDG